MKESQLYGKISITNFWKRRILRIWPLYFFCIFFGFVIFPMLKNYMGQHPEETANPVYYLTFLSNFELISKGPPDSSILSVLWSVAIEEQFYFIWPILLTFIPQRLYPVIFSCILITSLIFRATHDDISNHEYHTLSCMSDLCVGALGAFLVLTKNLDNYFAKLNRFFIAFIYIVFILIFFFRDEVLFANYNVRIFERLFISIVILAIILEQNYSRNSFFKMYKFKLISKLGKISYGLYCLQFIGILVSIQLLKKLGYDQHLWQILFLQTLLSFVLILVISSLSYKYFEKPFLNLKNKYAYIIK